MNRLGDAVASFFYFGHSPVAPGTIGTFGALLFSLPLFLLPPGAYGWSCGFLAALFLVIGIPLGHWAEEFYGRKDPQPFVVDEVVGLFICLIRFDGRHPTWIDLALAFGFFRLFDVLKLPPARQLEHLRGGYGIMLDDVAAGSCVEVFATAHDALVTQAGLRSGECVLIHAVGSGVGTAAVQLVTALGARAIGTTRTASKLDAARELGLDGGVVVSDPTDRQTSAQLAELGPIDVVLDLVGGDYVALDCHVAAPQARIMVVGLLAGASTDLPMGQLLRKRLTVRGTVLRARPPHEKAAVARAFEREVVPLLADGRIAPVSAETFDLSEAQDAYDRLATNEVVGKVTLVMDDA